MPGTLTRRRSVESFVYGTRRELPNDFTEFLDPRGAAVVSIDMHEGHLADTPDCPCPGPRAREIVESINVFHRAARQLGVPIIHVRSVVRRGGVDDIKGIKAAWRMTYPLYSGPIPNLDEHAIEGTRWNNFVTEVLEDDLVVSTKRRLSVWYATDLDFLLRNLKTKRSYSTGLLQTAACSMQHSKAATWDIASSCHKTLCVAQIPTWKTRRCVSCRFIVAWSSIAPHCCVTGRPKSGLS